MSAGLLSWPEQIAAHAAYVEQHRVTDVPSATRAGMSQRRTTESASRNRQLLLHALRDGRPHRYVDLATALPELSRNGIYYLCEQLKAEGRLDWTTAPRAPRLYRLT